MYVSTLAAAALPDPAPAPARYDEQAIAALYARHADEVLRHCRRELDGRPEAEDAMQTTFVYAVRALQRGVVPESEVAWLHTIATNVCHAQRRSTAVRARHTAEVEVEAVATQEDDAAGGLAEGLNHALAALPERQRTAFFLREWLGLPSREVAKELGLRSNETYALLTRARQSMATALTTSIGRAGVAGHLVPLLFKLKLFLFGGAAKVAATATVLVAVAAGAGVAVERSTVDDPAPNPAARAGTPRAPAVPVSQASDGPRADANAPSGQARPAPATRSARELRRTRPATQPIRSTVAIPDGVATPTRGSGPMPAAGSTPSPATPESESVAGSPPVTLPAPVKNRLPTIPVRAPAVEVPRVPEPPLPVELPVVVSPPPVDPPQPSEAIPPVTPPPGLPLP